MMSKAAVMCPHCKNSFSTQKKKNIQCSMCKKRFDLSNSILNLKPDELELKQQCKRKIKKLDTMIHKLELLQKSTNDVLAEMRKTTSRM